MARETALPAIHLHGTTVEALEDLLRAGCTDPEFNLELKHNQVTYRYDSLAAIRSDDTLPQRIQSFEVSVTAREGDIELVSDRWDNDLRLRIEGRDGWAATRMREIRTFFHRRGSAVRTLLNRYLALALIGLVLVVGTLVYATGFGSALGISRPIDILFYGSLTAFLGGFLHLILDAIYPYCLLHPGQ